MLTRSLISELPETWLGRGWPVTDSITRLRAPTLRLVLQSVVQGFCSAGNREINTRTRWRGAVWQERMFFHISPAPGRRRDQWVFFFFPSPPKKFFTTVRRNELRPTGATGLCSSIEMHVIYRVRRAADSLCSREIYQHCVGITRHKDTCTSMHNNNNHHKDVVFARSASFQRMI